MKTRTIIPVFLAAGMFFSCRAQSVVRIDCSQAPVNKTYELTGFEALHVSSGFEVELIPSDRESVQLMIPSDVENHVMVKKDGKTLRIGLKEGSSVAFFSNRDDDCLKAYVHFKDLHGIKGSGATEIDIKGVYDAKNRNLDVTLSGASSFEGSVLNLDKLTATFSGASELEMKGMADQLDLDLSGASEADLEDFSAKNFTGSLSGASKAELTVTETFSGSASGASKIKVKGRPRVLKANDSGASTIRFE